MKKMILIIGALIIVALLLVIFGWKLFGFTFCDNPNDVLVTYNEVEANKYEVKMTTSSSYLDYKGSVYKYEDGVLYVGANFGINIKDNPKGSGSIVVETDDEFYKIVIKGSLEERVILLEEDE